MLFFVFWVAQLLFWLSCYACWAALSVRVLHFNAIVVVAVAVVVMVFAVVTLCCVGGLIIR